MFSFIIIYIFTEKINSKTRDLFISFFKNQNLFHKNIKAFRLTPSSVYDTRKKCLQYMMKKSTEKIFYLLKGHKVLKKNKSIYTLV